MTNFKRYLNPRILGLFLTLFMLPLACYATKASAIVVGRWIGMPSVARQGTTIDLVLHVGASSLADHVVVEILPNAGYELVKGKRTWRGTLKMGETVDLAITIRCVKPGEWPLGARISNGSGKETEVSGALVGLIVLKKTH